MGVHRTLSAFAVVAVGVAMLAIAVPALAPGAYLVAGVVYLAAARVRIPQVDPSDRRPWIALTAGVGLLLMSGIGRAIHASISAEDNPFPSPADALAMVGYGSLIVCLALFIRAHGHRARRWRREAAIDGVIVAAAFTVMIFASILATYLRDTSVPLDERLTNIAYSSLTILLIGHVATLAVGSGTRNQSWRLVAGSVSLIAVSDLLLLLDTAGTEWASRPAGGTAVLAFAGGTAALLHPDAMLISTTASVKPPALSKGRLAMLGLALLIVPVTLLLPTIVGTDPDIPVVIAGAIVLSGLSLYRIWLLFAANERVALYEAALRDATATLVSATTVDEALEMARETAQLVVDGAGHAQLDPVDDIDDQFRIGADGAYIHIALFETPDDSQTIALRGLDAQLISAIRGINFREVELSNRLAHQITALVEQSADLVFVLRESKITFASPNVGRVLGSDAEHFFGTHALDLVHDDDRSAIDALLASPTNRDTVPIAAETRMRAADGEFRWFDVTVRDFNDDPEVAGIVFTARDVTEERAAKIGLRRSEQWFRGLVQNSSDVIAVLDEAGVFTYASPAATDLTGLTPTELRGRTFMDLLPSTDTESLERVRRAIRSKPAANRNLELTIVRPDGSRRIADVTITDLRDDQSVSGLVLNVRDVTDRKRLEEDLRHQVLHDDLTGLGSRVQFSNQLHEALGPHRRAGSMVAALFIDVDDFKNINDSLGHVAGDQVLVEISSRLRSRLRLQDNAARFGGDEFAVLLTDVYGESDVTLVADRVVEELSRPVMLMGNEIRLSVSVGIALDEDGTRTPDDLLRAADVAMYEAKDKGKGRWAIFEDSMADETLERFEINNSLGSAIEGDQLMVHYQPIVDLGSGRTVGVEALVRWQHPIRGMISPGQFIPIAENNGLIVPLGRWVLQEAVTQVAAWRNAGHDIYASVNISAVQLQREGIVEEILEIVEQAGIDRRAVVLELTESALINDFDLVSDRIEALRTAGLRVAIDDFGTGYASLTYADQFAADILKIDQSFVARLEHSPDSPIVNTVLNIAAAMGADAVAEGIEVPDQHTRLLAMGCSLGQGYYFTRPSTPETIGEALRRELEGEALVGHGY